MTTRSTLYVYLWVIISPSICGRHIYESSLALGSGEDGGEDGGSFHDDLCHVEAELSEVLEVAGRGRVVAQELDVRPHRVRVVLNL